MQEHTLYNILVIEDNLGDFVLIEDFLQEYIDQLTLTHSTTFKKAREILLEDTNQFDVILLDLSLPDMKGEELVEEILKIAPSAPVIILTGYSDMSFVSKSLSFGAADYMLKDELTALSLYKSVIYNIDRKKSTLALQESEKRYSNLFHLSPIPMWVYDMETLLFLDVNQAAILHYGYSLDEFLKMNIKDIRPIEDIPLLEEVLEKSEVKEEYTIRGIFRHRKKDGETILVEIKSNYLLFKGKRAKVVLANDITERTNYIKAIEIQNKRLQEIAWTQSHIVRAPLARLMGLVNLLETVPYEELKDQNILNYILDSAKELDLIIKDISKSSEEIIPDKFNVTRSTNDI